MRRILLLMVFALPGCATMVEGEVRQQAAFDYGCPEAKVSLVRFGPARQSAEMDVCGTKHIYHRVGSPESSTWMVQQETSL